MLRLNITVLHPPVLLLSLVSFCMHNERRPLLEGSKEEGAWDGEVGGPSAVPMAGGRYRLYYSGRRKRAASGGSSGSSSGGNSGSDNGGGEADGSTGAGAPWEGFGLALTPPQPGAGAQPFEGMRTDFERLVPKAAA